MLKGDNMLEDRGSYIQTILIADSILICALFDRGVSAVETYVDSVNFNIKCIFSNNKETRHLIREYSKGHLLVNAYHLAQYLDENDDYISTTICAFGAEIKKSNTELNVNVSSL
jgi:hypothetical protein